MLWGGLKVGVEAILWGSNSNDSTDLPPPPRPFSDVPSPKIAPLFRLLLPQLSPLVDCCLGRVTQCSRASCLSLYAHHHPIIIIKEALSSSSSINVVNDITVVVILDIVVATSIEVLVGIVVDSISVVILAVGLTFPSSLCCR
jgi:hypothetical protein